MHVYVHNLNNPGENLALEKVLLEDLSDRDDCCWLWINDPAVILGRNQILEAEVDVPYVRAKGIPVYRRETGGGAVYHDEGVVNFSFIVADDSPVEECLNSFLEVLGLPSTVTDRNDVLWQGAKIIGTAQRLHGGRRLFHGSLLYAADLGRLSRALTPSSEKLRRHGVSSVRSRVTNCGPMNGLSGNQFRLVLTDRLARRFGVSVEPIPESFVIRARLCCLQPLSYEGSLPNEGSV